MGKCGKTLEGVLFKGSRLLFFGDNFSHIGNIEHSLDLDMEVECICSNSTTLSGVRSSHLMVLNEHQTYVMCHQLFEEVVWISCNCTLQGAAAGDGACQKKKRKLVSPLPVAITTLAPVALCTGDDVCKTCDARAELVQAGLLALPAPLQALRRSVLARKAAAGIKLKLCRLSNTTFAL